MFDIMKIGEVLPKIEEFINAVMKMVQSILEEQKRQREMLESINRKLDAQSVDFKEQENAR